jgi:CHAD domain-containing protein
MISSSSTIKTLGIDAILHRRFRAMGSRLVNSWLPIGERRDAPHAPPLTIPAMPETAVLESDRALDLGRLGGEPLESRFFTSTFHDTTDRRLLRSGITLHRRLERGLNTWHLRLSLGGEQHEVEAFGPPAAPPAEMAAALVAVLRGRELVQVATLQTRRDGIRVGMNGSAADVVVDTVAVLDGHRTTATFSEIAIELVHGDAQAVRRIERDVRDLGARRTKARTRLDDALRAPDVEQPRTDAARLRAFIAGRTAELLAADVAFRLSVDEEAVHKLRVACRRLRSVLRTVRPLVARDWADEVRAELAWFAGELGPLRDLDVGVAYLREQVQQLGADSRAGGKLVTQLVRQRKAARRRAEAALEDPCYFALLDRLERAAGALPILPSSATLSELAAKEVKRLAKCVRTIDDTADDARLHRARILGKRTRYAAELTGDDKLADAAKRFQDVVGANQDALVLAANVRAAAERSADPRAALAAGRIIEREGARRRKARRKLPKAWRRLERAAG